MVKILIVDDLPDNSTLLTHLVKDQGYEASVAFSGHQALELASAERPDVILLDVMMPVMDGIEVCRRLKADEKLRSIPVILVTAKDLDKDVVLGLDAGADDYVTKPFNREILAARLRSAIRLKQSCDTVMRTNEELYREVQRRIQTESDLRASEQRVREQTVSIRRAHEETVHRLVSVSMWRDEETGMHIRRTGLLSELLAKAAGWSSAEAEQIRLAAPMHDVGKIGIPDAILCRAGKLSADEFEIIKRHTLIGAEMLAGSGAPMLQMAQTIALNHHERWDGEGYPAGLARDTIPESARIVSIVDVYDALTHDRVYRPALPQEEALRIMQQGEGTQFDPLLLAVFFSQLSEISRVALENPDETVAAECVGECPTDVRVPGRLDMVGLVNNPCMTS
jgi:putative two-component system response regulator